MHLDMGVRQSGKERLENLRRCDLDKCSTEINQRPQSISVLRVVHEKKYGVQYVRLCKECDLVRVVIMQCAMYVV